MALDQTVEIFQTNEPAMIAHGLPTGCSLLSSGVGLVGRPDASGPARPAARSIRWGSVSFVLLIAMLVALAGCSDRAADPRVEAQRAELEAAVMTWGSGDRSDYAYIYLRTCDCPRPEPQGPNSVFVVEGQVVAVEHFGNRESLDGFTAEDLFGQIRRAIEDGKNLEVTYDPATGLPMSLNLDLDADLTGVSDSADDPLILELRSFLSYADERRALAEARARWDSADLDNYRLRYELTDSGPVDVEVNDGVVVPHSPDGAASPDSSAAEPPTVTDLFDQLDAAITARADSLVVDYHPTLGHPISYQIDPDISQRDEINVSSIRVTAESED